MAESPKLLNVAQTADLYGVNGDTIRRWARRGIIPSIKVGRGRTSPLRFRLSAIEADIARREKAQARGQVA